MGAFLGRTEFTNHFIALGSMPEGTLATLPAHKAAGVPVLACGNFITVALNFLILAAAIFVVVRQINRLKAVETPAPVTVAEDIALLREIRCSLRQSK